ncbi:MAG: MFS transporter [Bacteroidetes bacterium]|nr:MAG: MFS transporter [Bacteroidota bacterium]
MHPAYKIMLFAWAAVIVWVAIVIFSNRKVHPRALFALFMVELWERFSYYGMRAILVLYMTSKLMDGGFAYDDATAYGIYGAYGALVYLTPIIGGWFADKMMGFRKAIIWGALLMAAGQFTLFLDNEMTFYMGLALLVIGNGFFKPNISSMIGRFYPEGDPRRDGAFTIFYMGINIGAFLTPLTCGAIGEIEGWKWGFFTAGVGMMLGYLIFLWAQSKGWYEQYGLEPEGASEVKMAGISGKLLPYVATLIMVPLAWLLIKQNDIVDIMLALVGGGVLIYLLFIVAPKYPTEQKQRIWVIVLLLFFTTVFWTFFELAGSAMNLFTERNVNKNFLGLELTTTFFQSINPFFIMLFAPVYSWMWIKLAKSNLEPPAPYKFGSGLVLLGLGFLILHLGNGSAIAGLMPAFFLIMLYLFHTLGELALSPVGLSLVTKLAPPAIVGFLMGIWFLSSSIAHQAGKHIAKLTAVNEAEIIKGDSFQTCFEDPTVKQVMTEDFFIARLKEMPLEAALVDSAVVARLNQLAGQERYFRGIVRVQETLDKAAKIKNPEERAKWEARSETHFLTTDRSYVPASAARVLPKKEAEQVVEQSVSGAVITCLRQDSLQLALRVFRQLGFFAIGCGLFLFLLGRMVTRWMHGVK